MTATNTNTAPTRTRPLLVAAAIPSALSLAWTAWSIADMVPAPWPVAVAAGIALDVALVAAVALAWMAPQVSRGAQGASWAIAALAAAAIGAHSWQITPALTLLAAVPLVAKGLWHLALVAKNQADVAAEQAEKARRTAQQEKQERDRRLSTELTEDEQAAIADLERQAAYTQRKAAAQRKLDAATSEAKHAAKLAEIERAAREQMKADEATADIYVRRHELAQRIDLAAPVSAPARQQGLPRVPDDASSLTPQGGAEAGFGSAFASASVPGAATGATGPDLQVPQGAAPAATSGATSGATGGAPVAPAPEAASGSERTWPRPPSPEQGRRQLVEYAQWCLDQGQEPSIRDAARCMDTSPRSISRYRTALLQEGDYAQLMEQFRTQ